MGKQIFKILILTVFIAIGGGAVFFISRNYTSETSTPVNLPTFAKAEEPDSQISPDGKATLILTKSTKDGLTTYTFTGGGLSFYKTESTDSVMSIPFNTWSTNNKAIFLKETTPTQTNYYVVPQNINVTDEFYKKYPNDKLQEVTGWADYNLLIVNANIKDHDVSLWFDINSKNFIMLSNRFN